MSAGILLAVAQGATNAAERDACGADPDAFCVMVFRLTDNKAAASFAEYATKPAQILVIVLLAIFLTRFLRGGLERMTSEVSDERRSRFLRLRRHVPRALVETDDVGSERRKQRAETIAGLLYSIGAAVIWIMALTMILGEVGVNLGPLIAGAGIAGVALGFGAQNLVRDFLSGIFMLVEDQYGVGDVIDVGEASGQVEGITLRTTRLRDINGTVWYVPNGQIQRVGNKSQQWSRVVLDVAVAYATDVDKASQVIKSVADEMADNSSYSELILEPPEVLGVENLGADGIVIRLAVKTKPLEQWAIARELRVRIKTAFDAEGIEIPFPQRTVWIAGGPG